MMPTPTPYEHPSAWLGPEMAATTDWRVTLDADDVAELERALSAARRTGLGIPALGRADVDVPRVAAKMARVRAMLEDGIGFALVRGLPRERYSKADAALIYWIVGAQLGDAFAQNAHGEVLGHVRDIGADWRNDARARGYQTRSRLPFHNDSTDVVALLCLQKSKSGGESQIVSSSAIHNAFLERRPDPAFRMDMAFEPGDMQFVCNYTVLHSRGEYEDWPEPERKRHLLRLWLRTPGFARLPPAFADRNADMLGWQAHPRAPVFDLSEIEAELAH